MSLWADLNFLEIREIIAQYILADNAGYHVSDLNYFEFKFSVL